MVTDKFSGPWAAIEEGTMNLVNSKDIVADRIRDINALAAASGRRQPRISRPRTSWRSRAAALAGARSRLAHS